MQNSASPSTEIYFSIVGLHAITLPQDPKKLAEESRDMMAALLATGLHPNRCTIFRQEQVPQHAELAWYLNCLAPFGRLGRMTTWKVRDAVYSACGCGQDLTDRVQSKIADKRNSNSVNEVDESMLHLGLFAYPVLQAADVLLYGATEVPVGEDQGQHIELTRDLATTFNKQFKSKTFRSGWLRLAQTAPLRLAAQQLSPQLDQSLNGRLYLSPLNFHFFSLPNMEPQQLIPIDKSKGGKDVVSARLLHQFLEVGSNFTTWFARRVEEYGFTENVDFIPNLEESTGGRQAQDFAITLDTAKELSMVERTAKGQQARRYFIDCEKKLRGVAEAPRPTLPTNFKEALQALLVEVEQKEALEQQLAIAAPKLAFVASIEASQNAVSFAQAAKYLKIPGCEGRNKLINRLRVEGVLMKSREPYQRHIDAGRFEVQPQTFKAGQKGERITGTTKVTPKGLQWLAKKLRGEEVED